MFHNKRQVKASQEYENLLAYNSTTGAARDLKNALILIKDIFTTIHKDCKLLNQPFS